jgi:hypothetical protein
MTLKHGIEELEGSEGEGAHIVDAILASAFERRRNRDAWFRHRDSASAFPAARVAHLS